MCKNIFACLFSVYNTISLSRHEQVCLMSLRFERFHSSPGNLISLTHIFVKYARHNHFCSPMMGEVSLKT